MSIRSIANRIFAPVRRALEGQVRQGPYRLSRSGAWLPAGIDALWWQRGISPELGGERGAVVEACISAYSQSIALCPATHWRSLDNGAPACSAAIEEVDALHVTGYRYHPFV